LEKKYLQQGDPNAAQECLEHAEDNHLTLDEKLEKRLLQILLFWSDDLGMLVYDIVDLLCERGQWHLAEPALNLAIQIAPSLFEPEKFQQLLAGAEQ